MRFLSTRTKAIEVQKNKIKGKLCCKAQEQRQMRLLRTRTNANDVAKHQIQMMLLSTRTSANEVAKHKNKDK